MSFRRGVHTQKPNQMIIEVETIDDKKKAEKLVGKKVTWESPAKKKIIGKITSVHGDSGAVRALFDSGMPGQSLGTKVKID